MCYRVINPVELYYIPSLKTTRAKSYMYLIFLSTTAHPSPLYPPHPSGNLIGIYVTMDLRVIDLLIKLLRMPLTTCLKFN